MKILFVCKHNRFRSKIAEAAFKKLNKNKAIKSYSAGIFKGIPVHQNIISIGKSLNLQISKQTKSLDEKFMKSIDKVIIVANNVPKEIFKNKVRPVTVWEIPDTNQNNKKLIDKISKQIISKVEKLLFNLNRSNNN
ncbi:MAG: hypothetical protein U9Q06_01645 [Nanoarchaeota archaeon]|nr:hypothetical protein [Nanoarchaeota archaeon]